MITEAKKINIRHQHSVQFLVGDSNCLAFENESFDCCRADRVFQHLENSKQALKEMIRVTKLNGKISVVDPDWGTLIVNLPNRNLTRIILNNHCDFIRNGWMGRQLSSLFKEMGLCKIKVVPYVYFTSDYFIADKLFLFTKAAEHAMEVGLISKEEMYDWLNTLYCKKEDFFASLTLFIVCGIKGDFQMINKIFYK